MNDPGLDAPIQDGADTIEKEREEDDEEVEEALAYLNPRWGRKSHDHLDSLLIRRLVAGGLHPQHSLY